MDFEFLSQWANKAEEACDSQTLFYLLEQLPPEELFVQMIYAETIVRVKALGRELGECLVHECNESHRQEFEDATQKFSEKIKRVTLLSGTGATTGESYKRIFAQLEPDEAEYATHVFGWMTNHHAFFPEENDVKNDIEMNVKDVLSSVYVIRRLLLRWQEG